MIVSKRAMVRDVDVLGSFRTGSDHRIVRAKLCLMNVRRWSGRKRDNNPVVLEKALYREAIRQLFAEPSAQLTYQEITQRVQLAMRVAQKREARPPKLSPTTLALLERRREMKQDANFFTKIEYAELCKTVRKRVKEDLKRWNMCLLQAAIQSGRLRRARNEMVDGKRRVVEIKQADGRAVQDTREIDRVIGNFYGELYKSSVRVDFRLEEGNEDFAPILEAEVDAVLRATKAGTCPGRDRISADALREARSHLVRPLTRLFNDILNGTQIPEGFGDAKTILLFKKGDPQMVQNYRPISLLPAIYKCFTKTLDERIQSQLEATQDVEQAGFRRGFSTIEQIHAVTEVIEKADEYNLPLYLLFVDFEKAFDSVEVNAVWQSLQQAAVHPSVIGVMQNIYKQSRSEVHLDGRKIEIETRRGVRQGDSTSPKFFNACLQMVFNRLSWERKGLNVDGRYLSNLRFADDIVLLSHSSNQIRRMLKELVAEARKVGLKVNANKTKVMTNRHIAGQPIKIGSEKVEEVKHFIYLGRLMSVARDGEKEIKRRIQAGWGNFFKYKQFFASKSVAMSLKRKLFNQCVLPSMLYGAETWALTKKSEEKLAVAQRRMERFMTGISLRDRKTNEWLRGVTKVDDAVQSARERKWRWARKVALMDGSRWARAVTEWQPRIGKRARGRPKTRWRDAIVKAAGINWIRRATDEHFWKRTEEAFVRNDHELLV